MSGQPEPRAAAAAGGDAAVPGDWCYQCGGPCRTIFAGDYHLPAHPITAEFDAGQWLMAQLSDAQAEDAVWLRALARAATVRAWRNERGHARYRPAPRRRR